MRRRAAGFSLVELVVTLVVAGILAAVFIPRFTQPEIDATWFHEQVKAAVRYAQRQAVAQRRSVYVRVQASDVTLCYDSGCATQLVHFASTEPYLLAAPSGVVLSPPVTFSFNGLGQPSLPASFTVANKPINVAVETGYVN